MADRDIRVRLVAEIQSYMQGLRTAAGATTDFGRQLSGMGDAAHADIERVGRTALIMAGGTALAFGLSAKAAMDWESAWAGVVKTVDGSEAELAALEDGLRSMATTLPATHGEIAAVAEAAGQLGIQTPAIEGFTRTMIDLGESTNLTADQAATALARLANIMGTPQTEFDRMGSTIVDLGNNFATTEAEIVELSMRLAAAGEIAGLSESDVLAFSAALSSVGVEAEAGGTALSKVFTAVRDAVLDGGDKLETFAAVAGTTTADFSRMFREDAAGAITTFIEGLGRVNASGQSTTAIFEDLELTDQRLMRALLSTASAGDVLRSALDTGASAWEDNTALADEAARRYETTAAQMEILRNQVTDLAIDVGGELLPALQGAVDMASSVVTGFAEMPEPLRNTLVVTTLLGTALLGTVGTVATLAPKLQAARTALMNMGIAGQFMARNMTRAALAGGALVAAGVAIAYVMGENARKAREAEENMLSLAEAMRAAGSETAGLVDHLSTLLQGSTEVTALLSDAGVSVDELAGAMRGTDEEWESMLDHLLGVAEESGITGLALEGLERGLNGQRDAARDAAEHNENLADTDAEVGDAASGAAGEVGDFSTSLDEQAQAAEDAEKALKDYLDSLHAAVDPVFGFIDAQMGLEEAHRNLAEVMADEESTAADVAEAQRDVTRAAADLDSAIYDLAAGFANGTVNGDDFNATLQRWVDQGSITEDQAAAVRDRLLELAHNADVVAARDDIALNVRANTDRAWNDVQAFVNRLATMEIPVRMASGPGGGNAFMMSGGPVYAASGLFVPRGPDVVPAMLSPGEFVVQRAAVDRVGVDAMRQLNAGRPEAAFAGGGTTTIDNSHHTTVDARGNSDPKAGRNIAWELRKVQEEVGQR